MLSPHNAVRALLVFSVLSTGAYAQSVTIVSGNGQAAQQSFLTNDPLVILVKNAQGQIVQNTAVQWTVGPSPGCPSPCNTTGNVTSAQSNTDAAGQASNYFVGGQILAPNAYSQSLVTASALGASASFTVTTIGSSVQGLPFVQILLDYPAISDTVTGPAGGAGTTPIKVRVLGAGATSQANQGIPGVGVSIASENSAAGLPSISCVGGLVFTDSSGIALCTPQFGAIAGSGQRFTVSVGGQYRAFPSNAFTVTAGGGGGQFQTMQCFASASVPPVVRAEGVAELAGNMILNCTGGTPTAIGAAVPPVNIQIFLNTTVTSRVLSTSGGTWLESLMLLDEPAPANQFACETATGVCPAVGNGSGLANYYGAGTSGTVGNNKNVFQGQLSGTNSILFLGVPLDPPGVNGTRILRIMNTRVNAN
ncbi:MAG: hypothetical protein ABIZ80_05740, partial [Bryobacteraceae bacterium]